jgi:hypothetical protein
MIVMDAKGPQSEEVVAAMMFDALGKDPVDLRALLTSSYLDVGRRMFTAGYLSHESIWSPTHPFLVDTGKCLAELRHWRDWVSDDFARRAEHGPEGLTKAQYTPLRLDPRTWGLTELMVKGYQAYVDDFFERHPEGACIPPLRMTQSALESLFSRVRG